mmetsp:Transcript_28753/g.92774  ORF Transcript_28753/g.92774 Transcript_28753/m.92774 type:complete len:582 (-) Transcript_28753:570-2315(-)
MHRALASRVESRSGSGERMAARFSSARLRTFTEDTKVGNTQNDVSGEGGKHISSSGEWLVRQEPKDVDVSTAQRRRKLYTKWRELLADDSSVSDSSDHGEFELKDQAHEYQDDTEDQRDRNEGLHFNDSSSDAPALPRATPQFAREVASDSQEDSEGQYFIPVIPSTVVVHTDGDDNRHQENCIDDDVENNRISTLAEQHPDAGHPQNSQKEGKEVVSHNRDKSNSPGLSMLVVQPKLDNFAGMDQGVSAQVPRTFSPDVGSEHRVDPVVQTPSHVDLSRYPNVGNHHSDLSFESSAAKNFEHSIIEGNSTVLHRSKGFERLVKEMKAYFDCKEDGLVGWFLDLDEDGDGLVTAGELLDEIHTMRCDVDKEAAAELVGILTDEDIKAISLSHFWKFFMLPDQRLHHVPKSFNGDEIELRTSQSLGGGSRSTECNSYSLLMPFLCESQFDFEIFEMSRAASREITNIRARTREIERMIRLQALSSGEDFSFEAYELQPFGSSSLVTTPRRSKSPSLGFLSSRNSREISADSGASRNHNSNSISERSRKTFYSPERIRSESPASSGLAYLNFHFPPSAKRNSR